MIKPVKGFQVLAGKTAWARKLILKQLNLLANSYGALFLELPLVENSKLYQKSIGKESTIVQKELFATHFAKALTCSSALVLRPEFTAAVVRFFFNHHLFLQNQPTNFFTSGNCFRYEQPQKGRYRQFLQWNFESIATSPLHYRQHFAFLAHLLTVLDLWDKVLVEVNYFTPLYLTKIETFLTKMKAKVAFCPACLKRFAQKKSYQILTCSSCQKLLPPFSTSQFLSKVEAKSYQAVLTDFYLSFPSSQVQKNPLLIRGLDYYQGFVFEIKLKAGRSNQNTIIAGGFYDLTVFLPEENPFSARLTTQWQQSAKQGFGLAVGVDRLLAYQDDKNSPSPQFLIPDLLLAVFDQQDFPVSYSCQEKILLHNNQLRCWVLPAFTSFSKLWKKVLSYLAPSKTKKNSLWLLIFPKEYHQTKEVICRQVVADPSPSQKPLQLALKLEQLPAFLKKYFPAYN